MSQDSREEYIPKKERAVPAVENKLLICQVTPREGRTAGFGEMRVLRETAQQGHNLR